MATDKPNAGSDIPKEPESLSATNMFLRGFESPAGATRDAADASATPPSGIPGDSSGPAVLPLTAAPWQVPAQAPPPPSSAPGEFTRMFQSGGDRPGAPSPIRTEPERPQSAPPVPSSAAQSGPGEFTRIFVGANNSPPSAPARKADETPRPVAVATPVAGRVKGFSSPGLSDSASGEGAFTQFFKSAVGNSASDSPQSRTSVDPVSPPPIASGAKEPPSPSVTGILSSLATANNSTARQEPETYRPAPEPYRPVVKPSWSAPPASPADPPPDSGGVTRLIQKLAQEQAAVPSPLPPSPPPPQVVPPANAGPGEFTRMISKIAGPSGPSGEPATSPAPAPAAPPPVAFQMPAAPALPAVPAIPAAPKVAAPVQLPSVTPPKLAPALPIAATKGKFDAIVPVLLVINTFLLVVILLVLLFQARGH